MRKLDNPTLVCANCFLRSQQIACFIPHLPLQCSQKKNEFIILDNIFSVNGSIQANFWKHPESYCNRVQITLLSITIFYWDFPVQNKNLVLYK